MVSFCLKSLDKKKVSDLESYIENIKIPDVYYSQKKFKVNYALIIHYTGSDEHIFMDKFSNIISTYIIENYERKIINMALKFDYFYFSKKEHDVICNSTLINLNTNPNKIHKISALKKCIYNFNLSNQRYNIDGLVNFRINDYKIFISNILEQEVHNFVVEKEYIEYVALLREYIDYQTPQNNVVHLFYGENDKFLLDEFGKLITTTSSKKYLSDISFSTNDFILNSILALMPEKLIIHDNCDEDNFISFLKSIFQDRCEVCSGCTTCYQYFSNKNTTFSNT